MTFPASLAEYTVTQLPRARTVILDGAGHMARIDQPDAWLAAIRSFLS
jgi:pimeloyl-ACP methyl ester carboxylesterase